MQITVCSAKGAVDRNLSWMSQGAVIGLAVLMDYRKVVRNDPLRWAHRGPSCPAVSNGVLTS